MLVDHARQFEKNRIRYFQSDSALPLKRKLLRPSNFRDWWLRNSFAVVIVSWIACVVALLVLAWAL